METNMLNVDDIQQAAQEIKAGNLIAFPTETVYGLGADATNENAVKQVYAAKGRPSDNPLIVHIADKKVISEYVETISNQAKELMELFWPGPLTLIFELKNKEVLPSVVTGGLMTAAFRMPNNAATLSLIEASETVLVGPSANTSGKPSPTTAEHVFHDLNGKISGILDSGPCEVGVESTVLDVSNPIDQPMILRPGAITKEQLERVIGPIKVDAHLVSSEEAPKAPGMKYKHYSPNTPVQMIDYQRSNWDEAIAYYESNNKKVALLASDEQLKHVHGVCVTYSLSHDRNVSEAMKYLFAGLRFLDQLASPVDVILVETYPEDDKGTAFMNRLKKSANQQYFDKV